jgi:hypothetical protein
MFLITFLTLSYSKVKFLLSETKGKSYDHFPVSLSGEYKSPLGWVLNLKEDLIQFKNSQLNLNIEERLSKELRLKKFNGFYILEKVEEDLSTLLILKTNENGNLELLLNSQEPNKHINSKSIWEQSTDDNSVVLKADENTLSSLIVNDFFNNKLVLNRMA